MSIVSHQIAQTAVVQSFGGRYVDCLHPTADDFATPVVAHHLSMRARFSGATRIFYSVGEHSVRVSQYIYLVFDGSPRNRALAAFYGLFHEMDEVVLPDISSPLKRSGLYQNHSEVAVRHQVAGHSAVGLFYPPPRRIQDILREADLQLLSDERATLLTFSSAPDEDDMYWGRLPTPRILPADAGWLPEKAYEAFMDQYQKLESQLQQHR